MNVDKEQKRCSVKGVLLRYLLILMICIFPFSTIYATDLLVIEEIKLIRPAGGVDIVVVVIDPESAFPSLPIAACYLKSRHQ